MAERLSLVKERVAEAASQSRRPPEAVKIVGISKGAPASLVAEAIVAGLHDLGENRVQEAEAKAPEAALLAGEEPHWHLVGHL